MPSTLKTRGPDSLGIEGEERPQISDIKEALRRILESPPFRTSKQCQDLLRYVAIHSLSADDGPLRERVIGIEVFGREPAYDTTEDPVVRVRAADVRKRLAQYYQAVPAGNDGLHIELLPGSYRAHFRRDPAAPLRGAAGDERAVPEAEASTKPEQKRRGWISTLAGRTAMAAALALTAVGLSLWYAQTGSSPQERFCAPITTAKQPVLIYLGANVAYVFSDDFLRRYRAGHGMPNKGPEFFVDLAPDSTLKFDDLVPEKDTFVTTADVTAIVELTTQLRDWKKPFVLRAGRDLSFGDLRNRPSIMIGAFNNQWTLELTDELPFSFRQGTRIEDRDHPGRGWEVHPGLAATGKTDDYAIVARLMSSKTGGPVLTAAGIGEHGTQAAAEFLASPDRMSNLLRTAPSGWENKNMEAVLHVKVEGYQPVMVDVVATSYW